MSRETALAGATVLAIGLVIGCAPSKPTPEVVPATGMVRLDGKPIEGVTLTLIPEMGNKGRGGYGITDSEGKFSLRTSPELEGVPAGTYKVLFQKITQPDGSPIPPDAMQADIETVNQLPERYNDPDQSQMVAVIPTTDINGLVFDLTSKGRR